MAVELTVKVNVVVPLPGAAIDAGLACTATPARIVFSERASFTAPFAPPTGVVVTARMPEAPRWMVMDESDGVTRIPATSTWMFFTTVNPSPVAVTVIE